MIYKNMHTGMQFAELLKTSVLFYGKHEPVRSRIENKITRDDLCFN